MGLALTLLPLCSSLFSQSVPTVLLGDGTPLRLRLARDVSSSDAKVGETVDFEVMDDIAVDGEILIRKGSLALAIVTEAQAKRRMGRAGKLNIKIDHAHLITGERVALRASKGGSGGSNVGKMTTGIVVTSLVFFPAAPLFLFAKGKDVTIAKGREVTAYIHGDTPVPSANAILTSTNEGKAAAVPEGPPRPLTNADIVALKEAGLPDSVIDSKISMSPPAFRLEPADLIELKQRGISDSTLERMLKSQEKAKVP